MPCNLKNHKCADRGHQQPRLFSLAIEVSFIGVVGAPTTLNYETGYFIHFILIENFDYVTIYNLSL